jgi:cytidylate kinase
MSTTPTPQTTVPLIIAIDGPAGAGKSTVARRLAARLGIPYLDTGAMYRAVGLAAMRAGIEGPVDDTAAQTVARIAETHTIELDQDGHGTRVLLDGEDVSAEIRSPECALMASAVSAVSAVRRALVFAQRKAGRKRGCVMEGRDIGSVVFPDASLKVFLTADPDERARRRQRDLAQAGNEVSLEDVKRQQHQRDLQDTSRADSPLHVARGSVVVDTTGMTIEQVIERLLSELSELRESSEPRLDTNGENTIRSRNHGGLVRGRSAPIEEESS